ncbi:MAG: ABC transporter permease, partial [Nocardioidaceae bacterium]
MNALTGTGALLRLLVRRDRLRLPIWVLAIVGLVYSSASAVQGLYPTQADLDLYASTIGDSAASIVMSGPATAVDTIGGVTVFEVNSSAIIATALMAIFLTVRHTRAEEESGRTELLRATVLGRFASVAAPLILVCLASVAVSAGILLSMLSLGLAPAGALVYAASILMVGISFTAVAALAAQLTEHARGAIGLSAAVLAISFVLRGIGDIGHNALSWLSPIGWSQAVHAFGGDRWWPLAISVGFAALSLLMALVIVEHRDMGAGIVAPRPGPARLSARVNGPFGLALRQQRGSIAGWTVGMLLGGVAFGSVGREVNDLVSARPDLAQVFTVGGAEIVDAFFGTAMLVLALVAAGFTIGSVLRLRAEEAAGRAEPVLATSVSRWRWALSGLSVAVLGTVLVVSAGGLGTGLAHAIATGDVAQIPRLLGAALAYLPATLVMGALAGLLIGWLPRAASAVWGVLAVSFVVGWLGGVLDIPHWLSESVPFSHVPTVPAAELT